MFTMQHILVSSSYIRIRRWSRRMMEEMSLLLKSSIHDHQQDATTSGTKHYLHQNNTKQNVDDIAITRSTQRHSRTLFEYGEKKEATEDGVVDDDDDSYKIVVGFLVPALLIVQWGVEWHNDEHDFDSVWEQLAAVGSILSILCFMVLAPCFIQMTHVQKCKSLAPIILLCIADILVVLRMDWGALTIMIIGNVYMGLVIATIKKNVPDETLQEGLLSCFTDIEAVTAV